MTKIQFQVDKKTIDTELEITGFVDTQKEVDLIKTAVKNSGLTDQSWSFTVAKGQQLINPKTLEDIETWASKTTQQIFGAHQNSTTLSHTINHLLKKDAKQLSALELTQLSYAVKLAQTAEERGRVLEVLTKGLKTLIQHSPENLTPDLLSQYTATQIQQALEQPSEPDYQLKALLLDIGKNKGARSETRIKALEILDPNSLTETDLETYSDAIVDLTTEAPWSLFEPQKNGTLNSPLSFRTQQDPFVSSVSHWLQQLDPTASEANQLLALKRMQKNSDVKELKPLLQYAIAVKLNLLAASPKLSETVRAALAETLNLGLYPGSNKLELNAKTAKLLTRSIVLKGLQTAPESALLEKYPALVGPTIAKALEHDQSNAKMGPTYYLNTGGTAPPPKFILSEPDQNQLCELLKTAPLHFLNRDSEFPNMFSGASLVSFPPDGLQIESQRNWNTGFRDQVLGVLINRFKDSKNVEEKVQIQRLLSGFSEKSSKNPTDLKLATGLKEVLTWEKTQKTPPSKTNRQKTPHSRPFGN